MALSAAIIDLIRDEIGPDTDFVNNTSELGGNPNALAALEDIYIDTNRGNYSVLRTALICWRRRLAAMQARSFDATTEGSLMNRSQRVRFLKSQVMKYELLVDTTARGRQATLKPKHWVEAGDTGAEYS